MDDNSKETNPKDVIGMKKAPISTLSCAVLYEMGLGMLEGACKYGRHNYRAMGVSATVYYDAAVGHLMDWFEGEDIDSDSGLSHVTKAMTALLVLRDSMLCGNWIDDRPLRNPNKLYKKSFNKKAKAIIEKYSNRVAPFLEKDKKQRENIESEVVGKFTIRKALHKNKGWYIILTETIKRPRGQFLHKDLGIHSCTGWTGMEAYGCAPGYYDNKGYAKSYIRMYQSKQFVCPAGWKIRPIKDYPSDCGWCVETDMNEYLHKDNQLHKSTTGWDNHKFGEAPGYWPTKKDAEVALAAYLEEEKS